MFNRKMAWLVFSLALITFGMVECRVRPSFKDNAGLDPEVNMNIVSNH